MGIFAIEAVRYAADYKKHSKGFGHALKFCSIPEEFFFQTLFMNSKYADYVVKNHLRYTDWEYRNGSKPAILDTTDFDKIKKSDRFFARKIDEKISGELISKIDNM